MKKSMRDSIGSFMAGKGFYIVLLLCVAALGVSGYYLFSGISEQSRTVSGPVTITVTPTPAPTPTAPVSKVTPTPPSVATPRPVSTPPAILTTPAPSATPSAAPTVPPTATASVYTWPVKGEILREHDIETLSYDATMADWRTHDGIDIACTAGTQVKAPAGGTVSDIYTDDLMGKTVVISHADGVVSVCSNLAGVPNVEIGDTVRTGDIIGSVGKSAIAESAEVSHLHLSMTRDGVSVDPLDYLPQR